MLEELNRKMSGWGDVLRSLIDQNNTRKKKEANTERKLSQEKEWENVRSELYRRCTQLSKVRYSLSKGTIATIYAYPHWR